MSVYNRFFCWLQEKVFKVEKPKFFSLQQRFIWEKEFHKQHPIVYFFTETLPFALRIPSLTVSNCFHKICGYVRLRFISKSHIIRTNLTPGKYHTLDEKILHGMFTALVDYVELVEKSDRWTDDDKMQKFRIPRYRTYFPFNLFDWRSAEAGVEHLKWEMSLLDTETENYAQEIMLLYVWWKEIYPNRQEPNVASGFSDFLIRMEDKYSDLMTSYLGGGPISPKQTKEEVEEHKALRQLAQEIEDNYLREDEEMLIRLVKIRNRLWI